MPDDPGRGDASWLDGVDVPDDLSELQADIEAYHRERRQEARRRRYSVVTNSQWWQRYALPAAVVVGSLTIAGAVLGILTLDRPQRPVGPPKAPIASAPTAPVGQVNGLVPDVELRTTTRNINARELRPALVVLVPQPCNCDDVLSRLADQAFGVAVRLVVVAPGAHDAEIDSLPGRLGSAEVVPATDLHGDLAAAFGASGVTVLTVRPNATVSYVERNVDNTVMVTGPLSELLMMTPSMRSG